MKETITYDAICDYCGKKLSSNFPTYQSPVTTKRELNQIARQYGWFCDKKLNKNVCANKKCVISRNDELNEKDNVDMNID